MRGREYFHIISQHHAEYNTASCDRQYTHCLRSFKEVQLQTFFGRCKDAGISWKELIPYEPVERTSPLPIIPKTTKAPTYKTYESKPEPPERIDTTVEHVVTVYNVEELLAAPNGVTVQLDPERLEVLTKLPHHTDDYPPEWDEPNPLGAVPQIKQQSFFEWQRSPGSPFYKLGLTSLPPEQT